MSENIKKMIQSAAKNKVLDFKNHCENEINTRVDNYLKFAKKDMAKGLFKENNQKMDKMSDEDFMLYLDKLSDADKKKHKKAIEKRMEKVNL